MPDIQQAIINSSNSNSNHISVNSNTSTPNGSLFVPVNSQHNNSSISQTSNNPTNSKNSMTSPNIIPGNRLSSSNNSSNNNNNNSSSNNNNNRPTVNPNPTRKPPVVNKWFVGQMIEAKDTADKWLPAEVLEYDNNNNNNNEGRVFIHFINWSAKWNSWYDCTSDRIRPLGADIAESEEEKLKKETEMEFRRHLAETTGFTIYDCDKDGNCLFRAFAHQVYNDVSRHVEVRRQCYDYMEKYRKFFADYVAEDFDAYIKRQRSLNEWGDHLEIVVMQEMFNKNVVLYDKDSVKAPKPLGLGLDIGSLNTTISLIKTVRLSFHGNNHYNSVVDHSNPPPLGDGSDAPIQMKNFRELELKRILLAEATAATATTTTATATANNATNTPQKQVTTHNRIGSSLASSSQMNVSASQNRNSSSTPVTEIAYDLDNVMPRSARVNSVAARSLMRDLSYSGDIAFTEKDLLIIWQSLDKQKTGLLPESQLAELLRRITAHIYSEKLISLQRQASLSPNRNINSNSTNNPRIARERLDKAYDELKSDLERIQNDILIKIKGKSVSNATSTNYSKTSQTLPRNFQPFSYHDPGNNSASSSSTSNRGSTGSTLIEFAQFSKAFYPEIKDLIVWDLAK